RADAALLSFHAVARALRRELPADRRFHDLGGAHCTLEVRGDCAGLFGGDVRYFRRRIRRHHAQGAARSPARLLGSNMEAFQLLAYGFGVLLTWKTLALMMLGLVLGIFVGVLPGLGGPNGVAILLPLTFT